MFPEVRIQVDDRRADESGSPLVPLVGPLGQTLSKVGSAAAARVVQISLTDDDHPVCQAESAGSARCSVRVLEFLWCMSHGLIRFYQEVVADQAANGQEVRLDDYPVAAEALRTALGWALSCLAKGGPASRWPPVLPEPDLASTDPTDDMVRAVSTVAALTLLLHEVSHLERWAEAHSSLADEERADSDAVEAVMQSAALLEIPEATRGIGVAVAFLFDLAPALWTGDFNGIEHPKSYHRLLSALPRIGDRALCLLSSTIPLLMQDRWQGYRPPEHRFETHLEAVLFFTLLIGEVDRRKQAKEQSADGGSANSEVL